MNDIIEVSYTGDLLAHRRCPRSWAYEKHVGLHPYEQVQAIEGHLIHHAMEWLTDQYRNNKHNGEPRHATEAELKAQLAHYGRVLHARGMHSRFGTRDSVIERVAGNLYVRGTDQPQPEVQAAVEGAEHEEYELRTVRALIQPDRRGTPLLGAHDHKKKVLLTGVLDVVVQQQAEFTYHKQWRWSSERHELEAGGEIVSTPVTAQQGDLEIWDYKGTKANSQYTSDYVRQVVTYAALLGERMRRPARCVLFFTNEAPGSADRLLAIPIDDDVINAAMRWTLEQVGELRETELTVQRDPRSVEAGDIRYRGRPLDERVTDELKQQCTTCGQRFDCPSYTAALGSTPDDPNPDVDLYNVYKN